MIDIDIDIDIGVEGYFRELKRRLIIPSSLSTSVFVFPEP